jgi:hypothetical protein
MGKGTATYLSFELDLLLVIVWRVPFCQAGLAPRQRAMAHVSKHSACFCASVGEQNVDGCYAADDNWSDSTVQLSFGKLHLLPVLYEDEREHHPEGSF